MEIWRLRISKEEEVVGKREQSEETRSQEDN